jgi:hypothetical protein
MDVYVLLVTLFVVVAIAARWPHIRTVAAWGRSPSGVLEDAELGFARIGLPSGWKPGRFLNESASLQAVHPLRCRYLIVISESREDFESTINLTEHSARMASTLIGTQRLLGRSNPTEREVAGFRAHQVEIRALVEGTFITYLHTTIEGTRAWHQVIGWATRSCYSRSVFDSMLEGFEELPGPAPRPLDAPSAPLRLASARDEPARRIGF